MRTDGWWLSPSSARRCSRERLLKATESYWLDPKGLWLAFLGTAAHAMYEGASEHDELALRMELDVPITLPDGTSRMVSFPLKGRLDSYDSDTKTLTDYKHTSKPFIIGNEHRPLPQEDHILQANLYRLLLEHHGFHVERIHIWYVRYAPKAPRKLVEAPLWDLDDVYLAAVDAARDLALARETSRLPACTCRWHDLDPDLCSTVTDDMWNPSKVPSLPSTPLLATSSTT